MRRRRKAGIFPRDGEGRGAGRRLSFIASDLRTYYIDTSVDAARGACVRHEKSGEDMLMFGLLMRLEQIDKALGDSRLQKALYSATARLGDGRRKIVAELPGYQDLRQRAHDLKEHTIEHLDFYLEELERNVLGRGGKVIWANTAAEACDFITALARERGVRLMVKSKSMTTEELHLNDHLERAGIEAVETDLGEYIIQLAHEKPYHIIAPAVHKTREQVAETMHADRDATPEQLTAMARKLLREKFLSAGIGITGANFLVADSGAVVLVENEGNARLSSTAPPIHIAVAGIEKIIPRAQDLAIFLEAALARSATGQALSVYTSFLAGARRAGEVDGPEEFYLVLLDNGRTRVLKDREKRQSLYCIRCGALSECLSGVPADRRLFLSLGIFRTNRKNFDASVHAGGERGGVAAVRVEFMRRLRGSMSGKNRNSPKFYWN